jgi:hypothetical protein
MLKKIRRQDVIVKLAADAAEGIKLSTSISTFGIEHDLIFLMSNCDTLFIFLDYRSIKGLLTTADGSTHFRDVRFYLS